MTGQSLRSFSLRSPVPCRPSGGRSRWRSPGDLDRACARMALRASINHHRLRTLARSRPVAGWWIGHHVADVNTVPAPARERAL